MKRMIFILIVFCFAHSSSAGEIKQTNPTGWPDSTGVDAAPTGATSRPNLELIDTEALMKMKFYPTGETVRSAKSGECPGKTLGHAVLNFENSFVGVLDEPKKLDDLGGGYMGGFEWGFGYWFYLEDNVRKSKRTERDNNFGSISKPKNPCTTETTKNSTHVTETLIQYQNTEVKKCTGKPDFVKESKLDIQKKTVGRNKFWTVNLTTYSERHKKYVTCKYKTFEKQN